MSETSNFNRLIILLARGGAMVLRQLLGKYTAPLKIADYFYRNQSSVLKLKFSDKQRDLVIGRKIDEMDITLLGKLVLELFKTNLTVEEKNGTLAIKRERDTLLHSNILESAKVSTLIFERRWQEISSILSNLADEIGLPDFKEELDAFIEETKRRELEFVEIYETLKELCQFNAELQEKVEALARSVEELKVSPSLAKKTQMTKCDGLKDKFLCLYEYYNDLDIQITKKMNEAKDHLSDSYSVFLYGKPGEGKTTAAFRIVKCLVDEEIVSPHRCAMIYESDDLKDIRSSEVDLIIVDDIFGKHNPEKSKLESWRSLFSALQAFVGKEKVRIIVASRMHIYLEYKRELDGYSVFSRKVELTTCQLTQEEKKNILKSQLKANNRKIDEKDIDECINQKQEIAGFPLCAQQFASDDSFFSKKADCFAIPYKYILEQNIQNLDEQSFIALLFVFYKGNKLRACDIDILKMTEISTEQLVHIAKLCGVEKPKATLVKDTQQKINFMKGTYLKCIDKIFSYFHDTIYETVAKLHAKDYPSEVIIHCTIDYLCQCVRLNNANNADVVIEQDDFTTLAERCIHEVIVNENGRRLSKLELFENEEFVLELIRNVSGNEETCQDFFCKGLSFNYVGINAFLYHTIVNSQGNSFFLKEALRCLKCSHDKYSDISCWKCKVKSEALSGVCSINRKDLYTDFKAQNVEVTIMCLYKAVENEDADPELVKMIINDLQNCGNYVADNQELQFCLGLSMKQKDRQIFNILKESGIHFTTQSLYFAVKNEEEDLLTSLLNELISSSRWVPEDMYTSRAVTEAHATGKTQYVGILTAAGAKLTVASVYWAIIEHGFEEVKYVINTLKENDTFDPESYEMAWSMAMAMTNEDVRIYQLLKKEGVIVTSALVMALTERGFDDDGIIRIISELKTDERWDPEDLYISSAYMASCRRSDEKLSNLLLTQGAGITPACLHIAVCNFQTEIDNVIKSLKGTGKFDPSNRYIAKAFVWSIEYKDKTVYDKLVAEGLYLNMPSLVWAVQMQINTLKYVITSLREEGKWEPEDDLAAEALNIAFNKQDKRAYDILLDEGVVWRPRNLYVAIKFETVHGLKLIIEELRGRKLLEITFDDVNDAIILAKSFKDKRKLNLLIEEGVSI